MFLYIQYNMYLLLFGSKLQSGSVFLYNETGDTSRA